jgi:hypothetical protein
MTTTLRLTMPFVAVVAACVSLCPGQAAAADIWSALATEWRGEGEVQDMPAPIRLRFRDAIGGRGRHLVFENRMRGKDSKELVFSAEALYRCDAKGACYGHWYDSRGMVLPLRATAEADRLVVEWGDAATERGRTTYAIDGETLRITDEVLGKDGAWKTFGGTSAKRDLP